MVLGFETAQRTPSTVLPAPSPSSHSVVSAAVPVPDLDGRHEDHAHILSHAPTTAGSSRAQDNMRSQDGEVEGRPPFLHCMLAGGLGGSTGDMLMHSLDTVKTRQQGDPHIPPRYTSLGSSYLKIFRQEGIRRGLYGGWIPALAGSFPATCFFFGSYEWSKRQMLDYGVQPHLAYLLAGFIGDLAASTVYVPSEVVKTRLQLQGRHNNPYFTSGYNYKGTTHAVRTIVRSEGMSALFYGYGATLWRDLPFSALQFMFYEQAQSWAHQWKGSRDIGWQLELLTGAAAGGLAGTITCPLDVVKTRLQTQVHPEAGGLGPAPTDPPPPSSGTTKEGQGARATSETSQQKLQKRLISTSSPSTHTPKPGAVTLQTSSMITGLRLIYRSEGVAGWFRGVGPRAAWTSIQSGCMLFLYQSILRKLEAYMPMERRELV
ncbi:mitochondrial carrier domain-containing protein [Chaetomium fimeti]|uniref:Mitochondrial carrier domain-containing protein n=1 Tax=Chaetomium fimeti TaxID=1854472 RepID=A0AAE0LS68_9PEZI|nr:mitochondrial carrier domain-containing protein [Chaetomium fimeti]